MSKMWHGPSKEKIAALYDPIACRLARKLGEQSIAFELGDDERSAHVYRMEKISGSWRFITLGHVQGGDVLNTYVNVALGYAPQDEELFTLVGKLAARRLEALANEIEDQMKKATGIADVLAQALAPLKSRYV
jgi:hypothetical protein